MTQIQASQPIKRPPVVVVVGHVDHGKTSLLDFIRKTAVAAREEGGITQSVGAYEIIHNGKGITFIDTPGHEAFSKMRMRGANIADIAILVVAADEGVKPQTEESIRVLEMTKTPFIVAVTKIDKQSANIEKVKADLAAKNVFLEGFGGSVSYQGVSSKTGEGISDLLDLILLTAEVEDLESDLAAQASGIILESKRDSRKGIVASVIMKNGVLRTGDAIVAAAAKGKVKVIENFLGKGAKELGPSSAGTVLGFESLPKVGEQFRAGKLSPAELDAVQQQADARRATLAGKKDEQLIRVILKADVAGSLEALAEVFKKIPLKKDQRLEVLYEAVGEITDGDVKDAIATGSMIIGFRVYPNKTAESLARVHEIRIFAHEIIYKLAEEVERVFVEGEKAAPKGELEILAVFSGKGVKQTIGGKVVSGTINNKARLEVERAGQVVGKGKILNLQQKKADANSVPAGNECGLIFECDIAIEKGDKLVAR